jgi:type I restriction enzyme S subunit
MKDSGIEWIGLIPEGWNIQPIKWGFDIIAGATPKSDNPDYWGGSIPWITPADYKTEDRYVKGGSRFLTEAGMASCSTTLLPTNSVIFSKRAPIGLVVVNQEPICTNQGCLGCVSHGDSSSYYYYAMSAFTEQYGLYGSGTTFKEISASLFADFPLPHPTVIEQQAIADYLDTKCSEIDALISLKQSKIDALKEYKKSIIYEYITGKKEVPYEEWFIE